MHPWVQDSTQAFKLEQWWISKGSGFFETPCIEKLLRKIILLRTGPFHNATNISKQMNYSWMAWKPLGFSNNEKKMKHFHHCIDRDSVTDMAQLIKSFLIAMQRPMSVPLCLSLILHVFSVKWLLTSIWHKNKPKITSP
jgi:hypothetical protein